MLNNQRKKFEESINKITNNLTRFLEREQRDAQHIYPHYFERFVTDGVDFNIYVGQLIVPEKKFNDIYLKNIRLWQTCTMALAAQRMARLQPDLPCHCRPLSSYLCTASRFQLVFEMLKENLM
jgi:hypothetical protein